MNARALAASAVCMVIGALAAQQDDASAQRCRELAAAQDAGTFGIAMAVAALADGDEAVARTAAAIVRHEWIELPTAFFDALDGAPRGARMLLRELAIAPRPAAAAWAQRQAAAAPGRSLDDRCLGLAARGTPLVAAEVDVLLRTLLAGEADDGWRAALAVVAPKAVDATIGRLHAALLQGQLDVERGGPWLDRLSSDGVRRLLGLVVTLPEATAIALCRHVHERSPELVLERVRASFDGSGPLEPVWIGFAGPCLDRPERSHRLEQLLADAAVPVSTKALAGMALLDARLVPAPLLDLIGPDGDGPLTRTLPPSLTHRALDVAIDRIPAARLLRWLDSDLVGETAKALTRRAVLEPELERVLVERLREIGVAEGKLGQPLALALVQHGSAAALQQVWPLLRASPLWAEYVDGLGRRREPFVHELLLTELQAKVDDVDPPVRTAQLDAVALALVALGDRRELQRLVAAAPKSSAGVVRRCAHHVRPLAAVHARQLLDAVANVAQVDVAAEMLAWAATAVGDDAVRERLLAMWRGPAATLEAAELREVALRALADSAHRGELVRELRTALAAGPIPDELEPLPYALLASMPTALLPDDLALCTELVLLAPRSDPGREAAAAARWPDGSFGFPLVAATAEKMRGAEPEAVAAAFTAASRDALADPRHPAIARQRLLVLWRELAVVPPMQHAVGVATANLALAVGGPADSEGPAHYFAAHAAAVGHDHAMARQHAERAARALLRLPEQRRAARIFLGERDPLAGIDPWAALSALPHVCAWRQARAAGDEVAATKSQALVREFAGHDLSVLATVLPSSPESVR